MAFEFLLQFAGIPFLSDEARVFRISTDGKESEDIEQSPPRKYQPKSIFLEELDRILAFNWINDLQTPPQFGGFNVDMLAASSRTSQDPRIDEVRIGDFYYPPTASRYAIFRGLASSSIVAAMKVAAGGGIVPQPFVMTCNPNSPTPFTQHTITTNMFMLPPRPISEGNHEGLYIVTLVDERFWFGGTPLTLHPTVSSTWTSLIQQAVTALGITLTIPVISSVYGIPELDSQLWMNIESAGYVLDTLAANIGCEVVRNLDGTYKLQSPSTAYPIAQANRGTANTVVRVAGGDMFASGTYLPAGDLTLFRQTVVPLSVTVSFPKYVYGNDPIPHFLNPRAQGGARTAWAEQSYGDVYTITVPITSGGLFVSGLTGTSTQTIHETAKAYYPTELSAVSGNIPDNNSGLTALALQVVKDRYDALVLDGLDEVYDGIYNWVPEGIHDIVWTYSEAKKRVSTRVMRPEWSIWVSELQHNIGISGSYAVSGIAGKTVPQSWRNQSGIQFDGVNLVTAGSGLLLVSGVKTSGGITEVVITSDGTSSPVESYYSGAINSGIYPNYTLPNAQIIRLLVNGSVYIPSFTPPLTGSGKNGWTFEVMNMAPFATNGNAPSTISWNHEDTSTSPPEWRINTPDGLPLNQQPQETIKFKYSDGRYKVVERMPVSPFPTGGGSPGGSVNVSFPLKWPLLSGSPGIGMPIPPSGYASINMGWEEPVPINDSGGVNVVNRTFGQIPHLEFVNASGTPGVMGQSPFLGWIHQDITGLINSYLTIGGNGLITPNPTSGIYSGAFNGLNLQSGDNFFGGNFITGQTVYISTVVSGGSPTGNGPEWAGFWVIQSGPWRRPTWYLSGQTYGGFGIILSHQDGLLTTQFRGLASGDPVLSQTRYNGYRVGESGMIPPLWVGANSGGMGNLPGSIMSGMMASGAINIIGRSGIISQQTSPNIWTLGLNLSGLIGSGSIVSGAINSGNFYVAVFSGTMVPAPGYGLPIRKYVVNFSDLGPGPSYTLLDTLPANTFIQTIEAQVSVAWTFDHGTTSIISIGFNGGASGAPSSGSFGGIQVQNGGLSLGAFSYTTNINVEECFNTAGSYNLTITQNAVATPTAGQIIFWVFAPVLP